MGRPKLTEIDTPSKRSRLKSRKNPYWVGVTGGRGGVSLGYRKAARGAGSWVGKVVLDKRRIEETIGLADDDQAGPAALTYRGAVAAALAWGNQQASIIAAGSPTTARYMAPTVASAVEDYIQRREKRSARAGANARSRLTRHVLSDVDFAAIPLRKLTAEKIEAWRSQLRSGSHRAAAEEELLQPMAAATENRLLNDVRAALNGAAEKYRRQLPPSVTAEIRSGTRARSIPATARKIILPDKQVREIIDAAYLVDEDFGHYVLIAAATGARHSQIARIAVGDVQPDAARIMVPSSRKGRAGHDRPSVAVALSEATVQRLEPILADRPQDEPLLLRWAYRRAGRLRWEKDRRREWGPAYEIEKPWAATIAMAGLPRTTVAYALRHSSIVRGLRAGLPVRLVAAL